MRYLIKVSLIGSLFLTGCAGIESNNSNSSTLQSSFSCNPSSSSMRASKSRFLSKKQLRYTIEDLFGSNVLNSSQVDASFGSLPVESNDSVTHERSSTIDSSKISAYFNIAKAVTSEVISNNSVRTQVFGICENQNNLDRTCADNFISSYAVNILRRPLNTNERNSIYEIVDGSGTKQEKLRGMLFSLVASPYFVWLIELGDQNAFDNNFNLSSYEIATKLSYKVTDSTPDAQLLAAAGDNSIRNSSVIKAQISRLAKTSRGRDKIVRSILRWSGANFIEDISSLPNDMVTGIDTNNLENAMLDESYKFVEHIVFNQKGTFNDLLLSKASFAQHPGLVDIYNHSPYVDGQAPQTFPDDRMGLLLRAPFLTHYSPRSSIINRGVQFQVKILCNQIPTPNVDIMGDRDDEARTPAEALFHSNRSNITEMTKSPVCMSCHSVINPTGFALENFDSLGRFRVKESVYSLSGIYQRDVDVDTRTDLPLRNNQSVNISNATDLIKFVANSNEGNECFVRNIDRFFNEKREESQDDCRLKNAFQDLANSNLPILNVVEKMIYDENLKTKRSIGL